ncbi:unnamed protein product, partial [Prorocentrum cordatum]
VKRATGGLTWQTARSTCCVACSPGRRWQFCKQSVVGKEEEEEEEEEEEDGGGGRGGEIAGIGGNKKTAAPLDCKFWRQHSRKHESEVRAAKTGRALSNLDRRMMKEWNRCSGRKEDAEEVCRSQLPERLHAQQKKKVCMTIARRLPRRRTRLFQAARAASARRHASAKSRLRRGVHLFSYTDAY